MGVIETKLTKKQLRLLKLIYTFRFATAELLAKEVGLKDRTYIRLRLENLRGKGYIGRYYQPSYKFLHWPAIYYVEPKALSALKDLDNVSSRSLKSMHKDGQASRRFTSHYIEVFKIYRALSDIYGQRLQFFTSNDLKFPKYEYFPKPLPDGFLSLGTADSPRSPRKYFLLLVCTAHLPTINYLRRFKDYAEYIYSDIWREATGTALSGILILTDTESYQKRLCEKTSQMLIERGLNDISPFYITTTTQLKQSSSDQKPIWRAVNPSTPSGSLEYLG